MKRYILFAVVFALLLFSRSIAKAGSDERPMNPFDIARTLSQFKIPRLDLHGPITVKEALEFIYRKYRDSDLDPPPESTFRFESRLPELILRRHVTLQAHDITMMKALERVFADAPVRVAFEPGKVIFSPMPSSPSRR